MKLEKKKNKALIIAFCVLLTAFFIFENAYVSHIWANWVSIALHAAAGAVLVLCVVFCLLEKEALFKLSFMVLIIGVVVFGIFSILNATGIMQNMMRDGVLSV